MSEKTEYLTRDDLDDLQELMKQVDEAEDRITKVVQVAAVDMEFYNDMRELYQWKAAQAAMKDAYYPYTALDGEFMIGTDLEGRPLGLTRRRVRDVSSFSGDGSSCSERFAPDVMMNLRPVFSIRPLSAIGDFTKADRTAIPR